MSQLLLRDRSSVFGPLIAVRDIEDESVDHDGLGYELDEIRAMKAVSRYLRHFLSKPHAELGRAGPVCPFVSGALRRSLLSVTACRVPLTQSDQIIEALADLRAALLDRKEEVAGSDAMLLSVIITFPLNPANGVDAIEDIQRRLKLEFVESAMMIGEFYPGCPAPGLHSDRFRPLDAPLPFIAIRSMTLQDAPFMQGDSGYQSAYRRVFGEPGCERLEALGMPQARDATGAPSASIGLAHA